MQPGEKLEESLRELLYVWCMSYSRRYQTRMRRRTEPCKCQAVSVSPRLSRPRAVWHRRRRRAAALPEPHVGGARRAGAGRNQRRETPGADPRRHRAVRRQRRSEYRRAVRRCRRTTAPGRSSAFRIATCIKAATASASIPRWSASSACTRMACSAVVHGCGYDHPSLSHFSSMGYWHTGVPNGGEPLGWLGRLADETYDAPHRNMIVNLGNSQSLAVRSAQHSPLVFDDPGAVPPRRHRRREAGARRAEPAGRRRSNSTLEFLAATAQNATESSDFVRQASPTYQHAGRLRRRRRPERQPPARRGADRRRACRRASTTSPTAAIRSTPTSSRRISTAGC